jgi:DNA-binding beta-propeller fold protein YncE
VTNNGYGKQRIHLIDPMKAKVLDSTIIGKSWLGLTFSSDEKNLFVSGGNDNWILKYIIDGDHMIPADTLVLGKPWPVKISPTGMALDDSKDLLYVVTKENNSLYILDTRKIGPPQRFDMGGARVIPASCRPT